MPSFCYTYALRKLVDGTLDLDADDIRALLVDSSTTADTEEDVQTVAAFSTLGELSGTGYVRKALAGLAVTADTVNDLAYFAATGPAWSPIDAGIAEAMIIYKHITNDADAIPIFYFDNQFVVTAAAPAAAADTTIYCDPLIDAVPAGTVLAFSGGTNATVSAAAAVDARSLTVSALAGAIALAETASANASASTFPAPTNGDDLTITFPATGLVEILNR